MKSHVDTTRTGEAPIPDDDSGAHGELGFEYVHYLTVVVPVYRSETTLPELHRRLTEALRHVTDRYEILFIEDSGGDRSWEVIERLCGEDTRVRGIQLSRNFGQHAATICGIVRASGDWILTLDDDLEHPPEYISALVAKAKEGFELVYAVYPERSHTGWRNWTSSLGRWMFRVAIPNLNYDYSSYRLIRRNTAKALAEFDSPFPFVDGYLAWVTNHYGTVRIDHGQRLHGASNYNFRKLFTHTINIFVTFSDLPLRFATWIGLGAFFVGGIALLAIIFARVLGGISVSGYASVMAGIVAFGGLQLLILGIFGEYLGRMNFKSSKKPLFLVSRTTDRSSRPIRAA
jgi:undecaprenyl-phosphate 4-deoxy-4-formamido-L-arabinose transferase